VGRQRARHGVCREASSHKGLLRSVDHVRLNLLACRPQWLWAEIWAHILPDDLTDGRDLEEAAVHTLVDEGVTVGQAPGIADERAVKSLFGALIVEHQQVTGASKVFGDDMPIVLSTDLIDDRWQAARAFWRWQIGGAQPPHNMSRRRGTSGYVRGASCC